MKIRIEKELPQTWIITPLEGNFEGQVIGTADGVYLKNTTIKNGIITGDVISVWGAQLIEEAHSDIILLRALGIGLNQWRSLSVREAVIFEDKGPKVLVDSETHEILENLSRVQVMANTINYES
jgi:hypothetical protein